MMKILFASTLCLLLSGCLATAIRGTQEEISITSTPSGANIKFSNGQTCITPCSIKTDRKTSLVVTITKAGYARETVTLVAGIDTAGVLMGGIIDYGTGAVYRLQPNPLHIDLIPLQGKNH